VFDNWYATLGSLAVRYTSPLDGEQCVAYVGFAKDRPQIVFSSPSDFLFSAEAKSLEEV
jgi:hypothetical protein